MSEQLPLFGTLPAESRRFLSNRDTSGDVLSRNEVRRTAVPPDGWPFVNSPAAIASGCVHHLEPRQYDLLMIDPPWCYVCWSAKGEGRSPQAHYSTMTIAEICTLPVADLAAKDCVLILWITSPHLRYGFQVLEAWGFQYSTAAVWHKRTKHGKTGFGTGRALRSACEPILIATRGHPFRQLPHSNSHRNLFEGTLRGHSQKPESAYRWAETWFPTARRAEVFSRTPRPGWDTWGDEAEFFAGERKRKRGQK